MAKETLVRLIDDLDGEPTGDDGQTIQFAFEGRAYEIDLSQRNAEKLRSVMEPFLKASRQIGRSERVAPSGRRSAPRRSDDERSALRKWARENGYEVGDRGRISEEITAAFRASR